MSFKDHVEEVRKLHPNTIYVALQGSQNYQLNYEGSDIDTKAIITPILNDIVLNKKQISCTHVRENNEHIDIKDIRLMFDCFRKQNINFIEILFTPFWWVDSDYISEIGKLRYHASKIARYDENKAVSCMAGMAYEKYHALCKPYPAQKEEVEELGFSRKQLHHIVRLEEFMERYIKQIPYQECLISRQKDYLLDLKTNRNRTLDEAMKLAETALSHIDEMKDAFRQTPHSVDQEAAEILNDIQYQIVVKALSKEVCND